MNDLDDRLRALATTHRPDDLAPRAAAVRSRGLARRARRRRRQVALLVVPATLALVAAVAIARRDDPRAQSVASGPEPTSSIPASTDAAAGASTSFGGVEGLTLSASPTTGLRDGDLLFVRVVGVEQLEGPLLVMCAGDVTPETAPSACDLRGLERVDAGPASGLQERMTVAVRRELLISREAPDPNDPSRRTSYDCATEPAGCVLAVGEQAEPRSGAFLPVSFAPADQQPAATPEVLVEPFAGLDAHQAVRVTATGLRPNSTYSIEQCEVGGEERCDEQIVAERPDRRPRPAPGRRGRPARALRLAGPGGLHRGRVPGPGGRRRRSLPGRRPGGVRARRGRSRARAGGVAGGPLRRPAGGDGHRHRLPARGRCGRQHRPVPRRAGHRGRGALRLLVDRLHAGRRGRHLHDAGPPHLIAHVHRGMP
ncbi:MAG: hypothetical protein R2711_07545 [Acidimicrobiales bacterium]